MGGTVTTSDIGRRAKALRVGSAELSKATGLHENTVSDALRGKRHSLNATVVKIDEELIKLERETLFHLLRLHHARPGIFGELMVRRDESPETDALRLPEFTGARS